MEIESDTATRLAETFHLLGEVNRLRLVAACLDQAVSVQALADQLGLAPSLVSHHLRLLRAARLMRREKRGRHVYYRAADAHVRRVLRDMTDHLDEDEQEMED